MRTADLERVDAQTLYTWPRPNIQQIPRELRRSYIARHKALAAYMGGSSLTVAAKQFNVHRGTLRRLIQLAVALDPSAAPWGFRACIPYFRGDAALDAQPTQAPPQSAAPHSFSTLVRRQPELHRLVTRFDGKLPVGNKRSPAFDRLFADFKRTLKGHEHLYPLNTPDKGRRALLEYLRRARHRIGAALIGEAPPPLPTIARLDQLIGLTPFSRTEFDAHDTDVDWHIEVPTPDGGWTTRKLRKILLLLWVDACSRAILSWILVLGRGYRQYDVMDLHAKGMRPWTPGTLVTPDLCYVSGSGMPSCVMPDNQAPRSAVTSGDNYNAHQAHHILHNLLHVHLGVWQWAESHIPEKRPIIESLFRHLEHGALRGIAGGFVPTSTRGDDPTRANSLDSSRHPLNVDALHELMDVIITAYNVTPHRGLHDRTPLSVIKDYVQRGGWVWQSSLSERHAAQMTELALTVTIRGSRKESRQPFVTWKGARYRSDALQNRFDLVGKSFDATIPSEDLRVMTLFDAQGNVFVRLPALPPWGVARHDVRLREQIIAWDRSKVISINGAEDAVEAYHRHVRATAHQSTKGAELLARNQATLLSHKPASKPKETDALKIPRDGWIGAEHMEDLP